MTDFLYTLMHPLPNAVMTVIMGIFVLYWLVVLIGGIGIDDLDFGFDFDVDVPEIDTPDADADADIDDPDPDKDSSTNESPGFFMKFLQFMNVGKVPFMLILSTLKFFMWIGTLITTQFVEVSTWGAYSLLILIPIGLIALFFTKFATNPMATFFKKIGYRGEEEIDFLGRTGKMVSSIKDNKVGSAEFIVDKNPIKLNVRSIDGEELRYGDFVIVADESEDKKFYLVSKEISIRNL